MKSPKQKISKINEREALLKLVASKGVMALLRNTYEAKISNSNFEINKSKADLSREDARANFAA
jgi:hypothetical protein